MQEAKPAALRFIFITILLDVIGIGIIIPVMPDMIARMIGGSISDAAMYGGWMTFAFAIMQFIFSPILGGLSDRYGRRPILLLSLFGFGLDYILLAFAPNIFWFFVGRIIAGITGASFTTASAYIADITPPEKRAQSFGLIGVAFGVGFIIGPVLGGLLGDFGFRVPFFAAAALTLLNCLYGYFVLPESLSKENRRPFDIKRANAIGSVMHLKKYPVVYGLVGSLVAIYLASHAVQSTWSFYTMQELGWTQKMVGYSLGVVGLFVAIVQGGLIRVINPWLGPKRSVYWGLVLYGIGMLLFAFATTDWMMYVFLIPYCLGGIAGPALQGILSSQVPANEQGELQGALTSLMSLTLIAGPLLMTGLYSYFSNKAAIFYFPGAAFMGGFLLSALSLVFALIALKSRGLKE